MLNKKQIREALDTIGDMFPDAHCELNHSNPFELVIAVALSAQCTDVLVNKVTKSLFEKYKTPEDYLAVPIEELQNDIRSIGLYRNKAKNIQKLCTLLINEYGGKVPEDRDELTKLPGVGRKTANVVVSVAFGIPAIAVDTHVERVSKRLAICRWKDSVLEVEKTLMRKVPEEEWSLTHHRLIFSADITAGPRRQNAHNVRFYICAGKGRSASKKGRSEMYSGSVPRDFLHEPFGPFEEAFHSELEHVLAINPFYYDICLKAGEQVLWRPWEHADQSVSAIMKRWDALKETIASGFRSSQKKPQGKT